MENGKPKLGIRFNDDEIQEIQGEKNNNQIPFKYLDIAKEHTKNNNLNKKTINEFKNSENIKLKIEEYEYRLGKSIEGATTEELFNIFGMLYKKDDDGLLILKHYSQPDVNFTWSDIGIDENNLFKNVKEVKGNADFKNSQIRSFEKLQKIGKNADFSYSKITNLANLQIVGEDVYLEGSNLKAKDFIDVKVNGKIFV